MPGPVDDNPELAAAIGRCSNDWSHVEYQLAILFCVMARMDLTAAVTVFSMFKSVRTQTDVLTRLARVSTLNVSAENLTILKRLMSEYQALAGERNKIAHNPIGRSEAERELYVMLRKKAPDIGEIPYEMAPISVELIDHLASRIQLFNAHLIALVHRISSLSIPATQAALSKFLLGEVDE